MSDLAARAGLALVGVVIGWSGQALTMTGRMDAVERSLLRIEQRLDQAATVQRGAA